MRRKKLEELYFEWLCQITDDGRCSEGHSYERLLRCLHGTEFIFSIPMDANRADDGISLRYHFAEGQGYTQHMAAAYLDDKPCSVLEMMAALALRADEHIAYDPLYGDRTGKWFWGMLSSMGLDKMSDDIFDEAKADSIIQRFLDRKYEKNGKGGLFTIDGYSDMRMVEIWCQLCWYMEEVL